MLRKYENDLLQKEHSGCAALLRDDKTEDLARMYRLFRCVWRGLVAVVCSCWRCSPPALSHPRNSCIWCARMCDR